MNNATRNIEEIAKAYYRAIYAFDFKTVKEIASPGLVFEDPTAPPEYYVAKKVGVDATIEVFHNSAPLNAEMQITESFVSNGQVVLFVEIEGTTEASNFGLEGEKIAYNFKGVSVLQVADGVVVRHIDYLDYEGLLQSFKPIQ